VKTFYLLLFIPILLVQSFNLKAEQWYLVWSKNHTCNWVYTASFNPDASKVVSASCDKTVKVWDANNGTVLWTGDHTQGVEWSGFSPDGSKVVSVSDDHTIKAWDTNSGALLWTASHTSDWIKCAVFSQDGSKLVTGGYDYAVHFWDANNGHQIWSYQFDYSMDVVLSVNISIDGTKVIAGTGYNKVVVFNASTGTVLWVGAHSGGDYNQQVRAVAFSPDGTKALSGAWDNTVKVWNATTGTLLWTGTHGSDVNNAVFSPDNRKVATASYDKTVKMWNAETGALLWTGNHTESVNSVCFNPDGSKLISGSRDLTVKIWNTTTGVNLWTSTTPAVESLSACFSKDGNKIVSASGAYAVTVWSNSPSSGIEDPQPVSFGLAQNFPNPFSTSTIISYQVASAGKVSLKVFDLHGIEIETLVDEVKQDGIYPVTFNAANLSNGIYLYRLQTENFVDTKKLIVMK